MVNTNTKRLKGCVGRDVDVIIGARIRQCRKSKGINQKKLADFVGVSLNQIHRYELGINSARPGILIAIAEALDTSVAYLVGETPAVDAKYPSRAVIENGSIVIRVPLSILPMIIEGAWACGKLNTRFKITSAEEFAANLVTELNNEDEEGTTLIHQLFDKGINEALEQGARGIEEHENQF